MPSATTDATATPIATPIPTQTPFAVPSGPVRPLRLERNRVGIVPGTAQTIGTSGGTGAIVARSSDATIVDAVYDALASVVMLRGRAPGSAIVRVSDALGARVDIAVLVAPAAGSVPSDVTIQLGGNVSAAYALARTNAGLLREAQLQPGATIDVHGLTFAGGLHPGDRRDALARVKLDGRGTFVDVLGTTNVHVRVDDFPKLDPQVLLYSDDPERLGAASDGVLYRATVEPGRAARAYVYHVSDTPDRRLYLVVRSVGAAERVQMLGYSAGPENAFSFVGHRATLQYLLERSAGESDVLDVPADTPVFVPLAGRAMRAGDLIASIFDLRALGGGALAISIVAASGARDPLEMLAGDELAGDGHGRRGEFSLANVPPLGLAYTVGAPEPAPFSIGAPTIANLRPGGKALGGDYGVLREVALQLTNPTASVANVYLYEMPAGGNATTTMWFTGDSAPLEVPCVKVPTNRYAVKAFELAAGETKTITGEYMTDGTSFFPLEFGLASAPPSPPPGPYSPDACTPKTPPPGYVPPTPTPAATPIPSAPATP